MNNKIRDFLYALSANLANFILGVITGFLIPMYLGVEHYGYFRLFTFYVGYIGFLHFGFIDGIYIKYGSYDYEELPKERFRTYFKFLIIQQIFISIILFAALFIYPMDIDRKYIYVFVVINMLIINLTTFFSFICQFTRRFKIFSLNTVLTKLSFAIGCSILFIVSEDKYLPYIIVQTICNFLILILYVYYNKDIVFGKQSLIKDLVSDIKENIKIGFLVMMGNFMNVLILGIDRVFVDKFFTINDFAYYSFAYNLISLFYILLNSVTSVIYPYLTRVKTELNSVYVKIKEVISLTMGLTLIGYFIIELIVRTYLVEYIEALGIFKFLTPTVILSGQISILVANYFKVLKLTKEYTKNNIVAFLLGLITNIVAYMIFKTTLSLAIATLISFIIWVIYSDRFFAQYLSVKILRANILEFIIIGMFLICSTFFSWYIGLILYLIFYTFLIIVKKDALFDVKKLIQGKKNSL